jgi:hypothetical protein
MIQEKYENLLRENQQIKAEKKMMQKKLEWYKNYFKDVWNEDEVDTLESKENN